MAKKRKGSKIMVNWLDDDISDGVVILRPEIRLVGSFDVNFARLFSAYASDKLSGFIFDDLARFLPKPDPAPSEEVADHA